MAFDIQFKLIYQGIRDVFRVRSLRLEKKMDISGWDSYQSRVYGFVAELLLDVWMEKNNIVYKEQTLSFMEKQNWVKKGGLFLKRKIVGHW